MSDMQHAAHFVKHGAEVINQLPPLPEKKNPVAAFVVGLIFGALGVSIYFKSAKDFFICLGMLVVLTIMRPFGPGEFLGWLFSPVYGAWRAHTSNKNLGY